jgi:hypothetical protein
MNSIATSTVHVSVHVAFDPIGYAIISKGKESSVRKEGLPRVYLHIIGISGWSISGSYIIHAASQALTW